MLILSRKRNERIIIGDDITILVVEVRGDKVRLGIEAPTEITVHREEIYNRIHNTPPVAEASTDVKGLGGADSEMEHYRK